MNICYSKGMNEANKGSLYRMLHTMYHVPYTMCLFPCTMHHVPVPRTRTTYLYHVPVPCTMYTYHVPCTMYPYHVPDVPYPGMYLISAIISTMVLIMALIRYMPGYGTSGTWYGYMVHGTWYVYMVHGTGTWYRYVVRVRGTGTWCMVHGKRHMVYGTWYMVWSIRYSDPLLASFMPFE